jgi:muramoyltetrapeptide carboxypeptidase LdcA involved in peptidoglycan recycling
MSYEEAINRALPDIPVIYDADIGHTVPSFTLINGAIATLQYRNGKGTIRFTLK